MLRSAMTRDGHMARPRRIDPLIVKRAQLTAATTTSVESLRQCQAVLLPALFGATLEQTAAVLGVGRATVPRLQAAFRKHQSALPNPARNWGGRRTIPPHPRGRSRVLETVAGKRRHRPSGGRFPDSGGPGATSWPAGQTLGGVPACWHAMAGERWLRTRAIPRATLRCRRSGKKTPRSAGNPADTGRGQGASCSVDVSRRGPLWTDGADSALLGSRAAASGGGQWLRTGVSVCLWSGQPAGRRTGLDDLPGHEHRANGNLPGSSQRRSPRRLHRHGRGWSQFARRQGAGGAREHPPAPLAGLFARNSIRRNICGMSFVKKNFRTGCFQTWPGWCEPWKPACHGWRRIEIGCGASVHGLGLLVSPTLNAN